MDWPIDALPEPQLDPLEISMPRTTENLRVRVDHSILVDAVALILRSLHEKRRVLVDEVEDLDLLLEAAVTTLPPRLTEGLTFSTFEAKPSSSAVCVCGVHPLFTEPNMMGDALRVQLGSDSPELASALPLAERMVYQWVENGVCIAPASIATVNELARWAERVSLLSTDPRSLTAEQVVTLLESSEATAWISRPGASDAVTGILNQTPLSIRTFDRVFAISDHAPAMREAAVAAAATQIATGDEAFTARLHSAGLYKADIDLAVVSAAKSLVASGLASAVDINQVAPRLVSLTGAESVADPAWWLAVPGLADFIARQGWSPLLASVVAEWWRYGTGSPKGTIAVVSTALHRSPIAFGQYLDSLVSREPDGPDLLLARLRGLSGADLGDVIIMLLVMRALPRGFVLQAIYGELPMSRHRRAELVSTYAQRLLIQAGIPDAAVDDLLQRDSQRTELSPSPRPQTAGAHPMKENSSPLDAVEPSSPSDTVEPSSPSGAVEHLPPLGMVYSAPRLRGRVGLGLVPLRVSLSATRVLVLWTFAVVALALGLVVARIKHSSLGEPYLSGGLAVIVLYGCLGIGRWLVKIVDSRRKDRARATENR